MAMTKREIFHRALQCSTEGERQRFLEEACEGDKGLRADVESLLEYHEEDSFLETALVKETPDPVIGSIIGSYKVLQEIGQGGMGVVYMAEQQEPIHRRVALKIIKVGMDTKQVIARFEAERQALALMDHPNIAKVIDAGEIASGRPYFVMELVRGQPLTTFCDENALSTPARLSLFGQVCRAVHHAHQKGIIHRDIKPGNVLVTTVDGEPLPKIIDFGIAKATNMRLTEKTLFTNFDHFVGTPIYVSPEQMEMLGQDVDTRSDIYSLGVLLYELLTGSTPIERSTLKQAAYVEIQKRVLEEEPPAPSARVSSLNEERLRTVSLSRQCEPDRLPRLLRGELDWIVMKAIEKKRDRRYDSAAGLADDISRYLADEPVSAVRPSVRYQLLKSARKHRGLLGASAAVILTLIVGTVISLIQAHQAQSNAREARRNLYVADMNFAQRAVETGNMTRALELLERHAPTGGGTEEPPFEWRYLWGQSHREQFTLIADDDPNDDVPPDAVFFVAISPDNQLIASVSRSGMVRVWDVATRRQRFEFQLSTRGRFAWLAFSPDGQQLAVTCPGRTDADPDVVVWNVRQQRESHRFTLSPGEDPLEPIFGSDGFLVTASSGGAVMFWNLETGDSTTARDHDESIVWFTLVDDLMITLDSESRLRKWDYAARRPLELVPHALPFGKYHGIRLSPDGRLLLCVPQNHDARVVIVNPNTGAVVRDLHLDFPSHDARWLQGGEQLLVGTFAGAIHRYATDDWEPVATHYHRGHQLNAGAVSHDEQMIVSAGDDGTIMVWPGAPMPAHKKLVVSGQPASITALMYSPKHRWLAAGSLDGRVHLWDALAGTQLFETPKQLVDKPLAEMIHDTTSVLHDDFFALSPDGRELAVCQLDPQESEASVEFWEIPSGRRKPDRFAFEGKIHAIAYSPDGRWFATGNADDGQIQTWDRTTQEVVRIMSDGDEKILCLAISPDSRFLASKGLGNSGRLTIWDLTSGRSVATLAGHLEPVGDTHSLTFSPDGRLLASAGYDSCVILWDTQTWEPLKAMRGHLSHVTDLSFSPDGKRLASSGLDNECKLWDVSSGQEVAKFRGLAIDFSPDGNTLAIGGYDSKRKEEIPPESTTVRLYHAPSFEEISSASR